VKVHVFVCHAVIT